MDELYRRIVRRIITDPGDIAAGFELLGLLERTSGPVYNPRIFRELEAYFGSQQAQEMLIEYADQHRARVHYYLKQSNQPLIEELSELFQQRGWIGPRTELRELIFIDTTTTIIITNPCQDCNGSGYRPDYCSRCESPTPCTHYNVEGVDQWGMQSRCVECHRGQVVQTRFHIFKETFSRCLWQHLELPDVDCEHGCNILLESRQSDHKILTLHGFRYHSMGGDVTRWIDVSLDNIEDAVDEVRQQMEDRQNRWKRNPYPDTMFHVSPTRNRQQILLEGLKIGQPYQLTEGGDWATEHYGTNPIFLSDKNWVTSPEDLEPVSYDLYEVKLDDLPLVADLPSLVDKGAHIDQDWMWWEYDIPEALENMHDPDWGITIERLVDPKSLESKAAIQATGTAACIANIPPDNIRLVGKAYRRNADGGISYRVSALLAAKNLREARASLGLS